MHLQIHTFNKAAIAKLREIQLETDKRHFTPRWCYFHSVFLRRDSCSMEGTSARSRSNCLAREGMVIEREAEGYVNRNGASGSRPSTSHTRRRDAMRGVPRRAVERRVSFRRSRERDRFGMNLDRTMTSAVCGFAMRRSPIITAHAKMQFKLQVHIVSLEAGETISTGRAGRFRMTQSNVYATMLGFCSDRGSVMRDTHRYIHHHDMSRGSIQTKRGNTCVLVKRRTRRHASDDASSSSTFSEKGRRERERELHSRVA